MVPIDRMKMSWWMIAIVKTDDYAVKAADFRHEQLRPFA